MVLEYLDSDIKAGSLRQVYQGNRAGLSGAGKFEPTSQCMFEMLLLEQLKASFRSKLHVRFSSEIINDDGLLQGSSPVGM